MMYVTIIKHLKQRWYENIKVQWNEAGKHNTKTNSQDVEPKYTTIYIGGMTGKFGSRH